ncbi:MBL fold metallo-hydrolase [Peribacillus sp. SCS-37]|uniref:MBL fold metallo-hydrolase n=1 Tax=Paraperibacillus esterisolvens TaxID=3115296 RepID=UPI003905AF96
MAKKRYINLDEVDSSKGIGDMLRWAKERRNKVKDLSSQIPQADNKDTEKLKQNEKQQSITWIGHSTFLIQSSGINILTDPVWAKRMGVGKRLTEPGLGLSELPKIDAVVISHGHYDHLDFGTIKKLGGDPHFFIPAGLGPLFKKRGYDKIHEAQWWDSHSFGGVRFTFVPAQHWTKRTLTDTNTSHWGGWMIESPAGRNVYFAGDTGYFRGFKLIGKAFPQDIVLMPIGAYEPEWFMAVSHINPEDSITAFQELGGSLFIPMHYGAYRLADDTGPEALQRLEAEWDRLSLSREKLKVLKIGETYWEPSSS